MRNAPLCCVFLPEICSVVKSLCSGGLWLVSWRLSGDMLIVDFLHLTSKGFPSLNFIYFCIILQNNLFFIVVFLCITSSATNMPTLFFSKACRYKMFSETLEMLSCILRYKDF